MANDNRKFKDKDKGKDGKYKDKPSFKGKNYDKETSNNVAWYNKDAPQYTNATKTPTWAHIQGTPYRAGKTLPSYITSAVIQQNVTNTFPGAMSVKYIPTPGISTDKTSPLNKAFNMLMSELYARTSGSSLNFTQASLSYMLISMASVASLTAAIKRMLGMKDFWITKNINYPRTISRAAGNEDYDDMIRNYNSYCNRLNNAIAQINSIKIPAWFDIFARQYALNLNVYLDEDSDFGQVFMYMPEAVWKYNFEENRCELRDLSTCSNVDDYLNVLNECLEVWLNSTDLYLINGALLRAFKDASFIFIEPFIENSAIKPVTDEYLSMQLMNATVNGDLNSFLSYTSAWFITEDVVNNTIIFNPTITGRGKLVTQHPEAVLMRCFKENPTADDNMEMTRLACIYNVTRGEQLPDTDGDPMYDITINLEMCGTEVITGLWTYTVGEADPYILGNNVIQVTESSFKELCRAIKHLSPFRFAPRVTIFFNDEGAQLCEMGDQYNYCELAKSDLKLLHDTALYSIWKPNF